MQNQVGKLRIAATVLREAQVLAMTRTRAPLMVRVVKSGMGLLENKLTMTMAKSGVPVMC